MYLYCCLTYFIGRERANSIPILHSTRHVLGQTLEKKFRNDENERRWIFLNIMVIIFATGKALHFAIKIKIKIKIKIFI